MKCPKCGYQPKRGRPKQLDDAKVLELVARGWSYDAIATRLRVSKTAIHKSLKRSSAI